MKKRIGSAVLGVMIALMMKGGVNAQPTTSWPKGVDEQVTVTCHTDTTRCVAVRVDILGNTTQVYYQDLHEVLAWYEQAVQEFVERMTVYLSDDWA